jgi:hypothetical protein
MAADTPALDQLARIVMRGVAAGKKVEIDGLGTFYPDSHRPFRFEPRLLPSVFIAYAVEDREIVRRLAASLSDAGFSPWMDVAKLLPGQNWPRAIECAIESSEFFIACFSSHSVSRRGGFQAELRYALDCARHVPLDQIFLMPVRLDPCRVPRRIQREFQYVDLFPDWDAGVCRLVTAMRKELAARNPKSS